MTKLKLFQYAVLLHPAKSDSKTDIGAKTSIVLQPATMLATDEKQAGMKVARMLSDEHMDKLEQIEIIVRPF